MMDGVDIEIDQLGHGQHDTWCYGMEQFAKV
jgi:hypothetical protein